MFDEIDDVILSLKEKYGDSVFFDDSRMWTLGYRVDGKVFGVQRPYLGGGVRGGIRSNIEDEKVRDDFRSALLDIEYIINKPTEGMESWEQNTGVLL